MKKNTRFYKILTLAVLLGGLFLIYRLVNEAKISDASSSQTVKKAHSATASKVVAPKKKIAQSSMQTPIDWQKPSEKKPYPALEQVSDFWINVDLKQNRTYLMSGTKVLYTMYSSGGKYHQNKATGKAESYTPTGTFYIEPERGTSFFNPSLNEGANNWISFKDHGVYLFHSVPTDASGNYNLKEAKKLGKQAASHGCIRLSVPDSKWMSENLKTGTKVVIQG